MKDTSIIRIVSICAITAIALVYDGELALIAVGALAGLMASDTIDRAASK